MKFELKKKIIGKSRVADCCFIDGCFETTDPKKQETLGKIKHVKTIKEKKESPREVKDNG